jgi:hypothetical protein
MATAHHLHPERRGSVRWLAWMALGLALGPACGSEPSPQQGTAESPLCGWLQIWPQALDFGPDADTCISKTFHIGNSGTCPIWVSDLAVIGSDAYSLDTGPNNPDIELQPEEIRDFQITRCGSAQSPAFVFIRSPDSGNDPGGVTLR